MTANDIRLGADRWGWSLWRNNSGVLPDATGRPVRYGLGNESDRINAVMKSSDWIGIDAGGRFVAVEQKPPGWVFRGSAREVAQLNFINHVKAKGGVACFATCWADVIRELEGR